MIIQKITYEIADPIRSVQFIDGPAESVVHQSAFNLHIGDKINVYGAGLGCHVYEVTEIGGLIVAIHLESSSTSYYGRDYDR